ncbi:MAG: class II aldolase/adducin family protein [Oscillochloridaceae bacterium umkhey_bin13]
MMKLEEILAAFGTAGERLTALGGSQGSAGNLSWFVPEVPDLAEQFTQHEPFELPVAAPALAGGAVFVTGSGCRLRDLLIDPAASLGVLLIATDGQHATLCSAPQRRFRRITSEVNSHLAVHQDHMARGGVALALAHSQPFHLTYLSHLPAYRDPAYLNQRLFRWEPETIIVLPEGLGALPYRTPGSLAQVEVTVPGLRAHRLVIWGQHGVLARAPGSLQGAVDLIEYAEAAAHFEYLDLLAGGQAVGLSADELRIVAQAYGVTPTWLD